MGTLGDAKATAEVLTDPAGGTYAYSADANDLDATALAFDEYDPPVRRAYRVGDNGTGSTTVTVAAPDGMKDGDILYAWLAYDGLNAAGDPITSPSLTVPFYQVQAIKTPDNDGGIQIWRKYVSVDDDPASYTFTASTSRRMVLFLLSVKASSSSFDQFGSTASSTSTISHATSSLTASPTDRPFMLVIGDGGQTNVTFLPPVGMTELADDTPGANIAMAVAVQDFIAGSSVGVKQFTASGSTKPMLAWVLLYSHSVIEWAYVGYLRLELTSPGDIILHTYGASMADTLIEVRGPDGEHLDWDYFNDDTFSSPGPSDDTHSYIKAYLEAGSYVVFVAPFDGSLYDPNTGDPALTVVVPFGTELDTPWKMQVESELGTPFDWSITAELSTPVTMYRPQMTTELSTPMDLSGGVGIELSTPLDLAGLMGTEVATPFDMALVLTSTQNPQQPIYGNTVGQTAPVSVTLTADAFIGDSVITVSSTAGLTPGQLITVSSPSTEYAVIAAVTSGTTLELAAPLAFDHASGSIAASLQGFLGVMYVCDKGGQVVGVMTNYSITASPTQMIMTSRATTTAQGGMTFTVPRVLEDGTTPNPDIDLVQDDWIVVVGTESGDEVWAGSMGSQGSANRVVTVSCNDLFAQFNNTPAVEFDIDVGDGTPAWAILDLVLQAANAQKGLDGELLWTLEHTGTRPYRGAKFSYTGDIIGAFEDIVSNSGIEVRWRVVFDGLQLVAYLVVSDRFEIPVQSSVTIKDGVGGNIIGVPVIQRDPEAIRTDVRVTGASTNLAACLPDYAHWAIRDQTPVATASIDPGPRRRRSVLDVQVPWGFSQATIAGLCAATKDEVFALYYTFLRAIHDMEGRPFHEGYLYRGPTDYFDSSESGSSVLSRVKWHTRLQLVETYPNTPASAIMISDTTVQESRNEWLIVTYNRTTGVQAVRYWGIPSLYGASMSIFHVPDNVTFYLFTVSGSTVTAINGWFVAPGMTSGTGAFCESYNVRVWDPFHRRYRYLRRVISSQWKGKYIDPSDPNVTFTELGAGAGIEEDQLGQLIGKVYDFELYNIDLWDPYRDGVGAFLARETVFSGKLTTKARWHIVPYSAGVNASTTLETGIYPAETSILVTSYAGFPSSDTGGVPFKIAVDDGPDQENMLVTATAGLDWTVTRAQDGTTAITHEAGAPVRRLDGGQAEGLTPMVDSWPEGEAYAQEILAMLQAGALKIEVDVANIGGGPSADAESWPYLQLGALVTVDISTEDTLGFSGEARIIGRSPDPFGVSGPPGALKLVLEPLP